jgi:hypothetical protein
MKVARIECGIPIPVPRNGDKRTRWPIDELRVGESLYKKTDNMGHFGQIMRRAKRRFPSRNYTCRSVSGGTRIWRIK